MKLSQVGSYDIICELGSHATFHNPTTTHSGRKAKSSERRKKNKKRRGIIPTIMATSLRRRKHSPWTNLDPDTERAI